MSIATSCLLPREFSILCCHYNYPFMLFAPFIRLLWPNQVVRTGCGSHRSPSFPGRDPNTIIPATISLQGFLWLD